LVTHDQLESAKWAKAGSELAIASGGSRCIPASRVTLPPLVGRLVNMIEQSAK
jgi:hypothetical protein